MELDSVMIGIDLWGIIDRIKLEADSVDEMAKMVKAEIKAYINMISKENPYMVNMYKESLSINNMDYVAIGEIYKTEQDYKNKNPHYIIPTSFINGKSVYVVEYKLI